jgi:4'-phosphopantetheinyl transferase
MVNLHTIPLNMDPESVERFHRILSREEKNRAARFLLPEHRKRFIVSHGALRQVLAPRLGCAPETIRFGSAAHGKPIVVWPEGACSFSLSHSADLAVVAVSREGEVGVDIEQRQPDRPFLELAKKYFFTRETLYLSGLDESDRILEFYRMWTLKESWLKAAGKGLAGLETVEIIPGAEKKYDVRIHHSASTGSPEHGREFEWNYFETRPGYTGCYTRLYSSQTVSTI